MPLVKSRNSLVPFTIPAYTGSYTYGGAGPYDNTRPFGWTLPANSPGPGMLETLTYDGGLKTTRLIVEGVQHEFPIFKSCVHSKHYCLFNDGAGGVQAGRYFVGGLPVVWQRSIPGRPFYTGFNFFDTPANLANIGLCLKHNDIVAAYGTYAPSALKARALNDSKLLGFPDAFNVLNSILEFRDVKRLPDLLRKWHGNSHDLSDKFLGTNFGLIPFFSDIMSIIDRVSNSGKAVDKWNSMASRSKILNAHANLPPPSLVTSHPNFVGYEKGKARLEKKGVTIHIAQNDFSAYTPDNGSQDMIVNITQEITSIGHVYFIPLHIEDINEIKRHLWGVDRPLTALWNAVPYSFVIDWIMNIGNLIQTFEEGNPLLKMKIVSAGYTVKVVTHCSLATTFGGFDTGTIICKDVHYERVPLSPSSILEADKFYPFEMKLLSGEQTLLGSALLHQLLK